LNNLLRHRVDKKRGGKDIEDMEGASKATGKKGGGIEERR